MISGVKWSDCCIACAGDVVIVQSSKYLIAASPKTPGSWKGSNILRIVSNHSIVVTYLLLAYAEGLQRKALGFRVRVTVLHHFSVEGKSPFGVTQ